MCVGSSLFLSSVEREAFLHENVLFFNISQQWRRQRVNAKTKTCFSIIPSSLSLLISGATSWLGRGFCPSPFRPHDIHSTIQLYAKIPRSLPWNWLHHSMPMPYLIISRLARWTLLESLTSPTNTLIMLLITKSPNKNLQLSWAYIYKPPGSVES